MFFLKWYLLLTLGAEIRMVKYNDTSKLYSTFGKIGKTIDVKMTAKVLSKDSIFALAWRTNLNMQSCCEGRLQNFLTIIFRFFNRFLCLSLNENLFLLNFLLHSFIWFPVLRLMQTTTQNCCLWKIPFYCN